MGTIKLRTEKALKEFGIVDQDLDINEFAEMAIYETGDNFREKGFAPLVLKGSKYLYTSA